MRSRQQADPCSAGVGSAGDRVRERGLKGRGMHRPKRRVPAVLAFVLLGPFVGSTLAHGRGSAVVSSPAIATSRLRMYTAAVDAGTATQIAQAGYDVASSHTMRNGRVRIDLVLYPRDVDGLEEAGCSAARVAERRRAHGARARGSPARARVRGVDAIRRTQWLPRMDEQVHRRQPRHREARGHRAHVGNGSGGRRGHPP